MSPSVGGKSLDRNTGKVWRKWRIWVLSLAWGDAWRLDTGFPTSGRRVRWCVAIFRFRKVNEKLRFVLQYGLVFKNKHIIDHRGWGCYFYFFKGTFGLVFEFSKKKKGLFSSIKYYTVGKD